MRALAQSLARATAWLTVFACRHSWLTLVLLTVVSAAGGWLALNRLAIDTSTDEMLSPDLPFRQADKRLKSEFPMLDETLVVLVEGPTLTTSQEAARALAERMTAEQTLYADVFYPEGEPFLRRHGLLYLSMARLEDLVDRLAQAQPLIATLAEKPSLVGLADVLEPALQQESAEALDGLKPALEAMSAAAAKAAAGETVAVSWQELFDPTAEADSQLQIIVARPLLDYSSLAPAQAALSGVHRLAGELNLDAAGVTVSLTGKPAMKADELDTIKSNIAGLGLLSFGIVAGLLWLGLGSARPAFAVALLLVLGLALTAGFATLVIGRLNLISVAFAVLFIGLSVSYALHFLMRVEEERAAGEGVVPGLMRAARELAPALTLCAATTALAFLSFLPTPYLGLAELGIISAAGIGIALFLTFTLVPAVVRLVGLPPRTFEHGLFGAKAEVYLIRHRRVLLLVAALIAIGCAVLLPRVTFDDDPLSLRDPTSPSVIALARVVSDPRAEPYKADILRADLQAADALAAKLEALPEVRSAVTYTDLVPKEQDEKLAILEDAGFLLAPLLSPANPAPPLTPEERQAAAERLVAMLRDAPPSLAEPAAQLSSALGSALKDPAHLTAVEAALIGDLPQRLEELAEALQADRVVAEDLPKALTDRYLAPNGTARIEVRPQQDLRQSGPRHAFAAAVLALAPDAAGDAIVVTQAGRTVLDTFDEAGLIAFFSVGFLVFAVRRRLSETGLALLPLVLAGLLTAGVMVVLGLQLNFANVIVLPLLFGLGIDSSLHLVVRHRQAPDRPLLENSTPRAILFSALTTIASFGTLAISAHPGTASMGVLLVVALSSVLITTFLVLPALIGWRRPVAGRAARG